MPRQRVQFESLEQLEQSLRSASGEMLETLAALDSEVSTLRGQWTGEASDAYDVAHAEWTHQMDGVSKFLDRIASSLAASRTTLDGAEKGFAAQF